MQGRNETQIHPNAVVEEGAQIGQGCQIGPFCHVGPDVRLGDGVVLGFEGQCDQNRAEDFFLHNGRCVVVQRIQGWFDEIAGSGVEFAAEYSACCVISDLHVAFDIGLGTG